MKNLEAAIDNGTLSDKLRNHKTQPKLSLRGTGNTEIKNYVEARTEQQKILQRLGKDLGVRVLFVDNPNKDFHGAHINGTSVINVNSDFAFTKVFWHESAHWLKINNPELYRRLVKAAGITDAQRQNYIEETGRTDLTTDAAIDEEIIADQLEDVMKRAGFLRDIGRKDQSLIERVIAWLQDLMSKFREYFQNPKGKLTREQAQRMANEFGRMAKTIVNRDGKPIFRYNNKTHSVELATGESLDKLYETAQREKADMTKTEKIYERLDEQTKLHNEFKLTKKRPEGYDHNLYTRLTNTQKEMRKFAKSERKIIDDPSLDFDERDERRKKLQKRRTEPAERALR